MSLKFSWRFYQPGDEVEINKLYTGITGRERSAKQFNWQWLSAPGGQGDIALIHAEQEEGIRLIGHHGVMPIRFTCGEQDLLFGKIENTMVHPEYRDKIIYPRFEKRFKQAYENRYHALFATMGPEAAIRVRHATGYKFPVLWQRYQLAVSPVSQLFFPAKLLINKLIKPRYSTDGLDSHSLMIDAGFLDSGRAKQSAFFDSFWTEARVHHGIAPRRDKADLCWRFWDTPYKAHFTFLLDESDKNSGYAIVSIDPAEPKRAFLEDYAVNNPIDSAYKLLFNGLFNALHTAGISVLNVTTTEDPALKEIGEIFKRHQLLVYRMRNWLVSQKTAMGMPRFITEKGSLESLEYSNWHTTGIVFEGRA